jgi:hypothetical protein
MSLFSIATDSDGTRGNSTPIKRDPPRRPQQVLTPKHPPVGRPAGRTASRATPAATLTPAQITVLKNKGLVGYKGRGKPPVANDIWVDNPKTNNKSMLCSNFSTVGYYCRFGDACGFFHFRSLQDLPEGPRAAYKTFVEQTEGLSFCTINREG